MGTDKTKVTEKVDTSKYPGLDKLLNGLTGRASSIDATAFKKNPFLELADFNQDEQNAYQGVRDQQGVYEEDIRTLIDRATNAPTAEGIQPWMDPFIKNVLNDVTGRISEEGDRTQRGISDAAKFTNSFGGSRQAILEAMNMSDTQRNIGEATNRGMSDAFNNAMERYYGSVGLGMGAIGEGQRSKYLDLSSLENIGRTQREDANRQQGLYSEDFLREQDDPYKKLQALALGSTSFPYQVLTKTQTTEQKQSPWNAILGAAMAGAGAMTGNPGLAMGGLGQLSGGATGQAGGGGLGSLWSSVSPSGFRDGGLVTGQESPLGSDEALQPGNDVLRSLTMAPELLSPPDAGGNPVAKLLGMFKSNSRATGPTGLTQSFANGGLVSGLLGGALGSKSPRPMNEQMPSSGSEAKKFSFKDLFNGTNPEGLIEIGLRMMASDKPVGAAIGEAFLGYKQGIEAEDDETLANAMTGLKMQEIMARMGLNAEKFEEQQNMNDFRVSDMIADNEARDQSLGQTLAMFAAGQGATQSRWEADFNRRLDEFAKTHEADGTPKGTKKATNYVGLDDVLKNAQDIIDGKPVVEGDLYSPSVYGDIDSTAADLDAYADQAFESGEDGLAMRVQAKADALREKKAREAKKLGIGIGGQ